LTQDQLGPLSDFNQSGLTWCLKCIGKVVHIIDKMHMNMSAPNTLVYFLCWYGPGIFYVCIKYCEIQINVTFPSTRLLKAVCTYCTGIHVAAMCCMYITEMQCIQCIFQYHGEDTHWNWDKHYEERVRLIYSTIR